MILLSFFLNWSETKLGGCASTSVCMSQCCSYRYMPQTERFDCTTIVQRLDIRFNCPFKILIWCESLFSRRYQSRHRRRVIVALFCCNHLFTVLSQVPVNDQKAQGFRWFHISYFSEVAAAKTSISGKSFPFQC